MNIYSKVPLRISLFGGSTDYPHYYKNYGSEILNMAINKFVRIEYRKLNPATLANYRFVYRKIEMLRNSEESENPVFKNIFKFTKIYQPGEYNYQSDLPSMSGVGSSSAFIIAMTNLLNFIKYKKTLNSKNLANQAIFFEQKILRECVGVQDQITCAHGGFNRISIDKKGNYKVKNLMNNYHNRINLLTDSLLLIYSGVRRFSNVEALSQKKKIIQSDLSFLSESALNAEKIIKNKNVSIYEIGRLLKSNWEIKKTLSKRMTIPQSEEIISLCMKNQGIGGKVIGTGNGGFVLFQVKKEYQKCLIKKLKKFLVLKFKCFNEKPSINEVII